jgi:hypothetical protein
MTHLVELTLPFKQFFGSGLLRDTKEFSPMNRQEVEVEDSLIVEGVQAFRAQRENLPRSRSAEERCKVDKPVSGS